MFVNNSIRQMKTKNGSKYTEIQIDTLFTEKQLTNHPRHGDMIILEYATKQKEVEQFERRYAYIKELRQIQKDPKMYNENLGMYLVL